MEYSTEERDRNKVLFESSEILESPSCVTNHEYQSIQSLHHVAEYQLISYNLNRASKVNNTSPFFLKVRLNLENVAYLDKSDSTQKTNAEVVFYSNPINVLNSGFPSRRGILISSNYLLHSLLSCFIDTMRDSMYKVHLIHSKEHIILLPSYDVEYALKFYTLQKIDSYFTGFDFKSSSILESSKLFPGFEDVFRENCPQETKENDHNFASSSTNELNFLNQTFPNSIHTDYDVRLFASAITNCYEKKLNSYRDIPNFKSHSVKSADYSADLIKTYKHICFPMKKFINPFRKQKVTSVDRIHNVFTKNRQFSRKALCQNNTRFNFKRFYFAKNVNPTNADDSVSFDISEKDDDDYCCSIDKKLSGMHVKSKIAEIRQRVENLTCGINKELNRREQYHLSIVEQCKRVCNSTISFHDYNEIYHSNSLENLSEVSWSNETSEDILLNHKTTDSHYEVFHQSQIIPPTQVPQQTETSVPHIQASNSHEVSESFDHVLSQIKKVNFPEQILKRNGVLAEKYPKYLELMFVSFRYHIVAALDTISLPFVALLLSKR